MAVKILLAVIAACLVSALSAVLVGEDGKVEPVKLKAGKGAKNLVRAAYDDGLEIAEDDEEASARTHGLVDTLVRPAMGKGSGSSKSEKATALSPLAARAVNFLGSASLEVLRELSTRLEADIKAHKKSMEDRKSSKKGLSGDAASSTAAGLDDVVKTTDKKGDNKPSSTPSSPKIPASEAPDAAETANDETVSFTSPEKTSSDKFIQIGPDRVPRSKVTFIGDIDGNGIEDYVILTASEGKDSGAVRLYLMDANNAVKAQRHLVPGKWGFDAQKLVSGDRFGSSILQVGDLNGDGVKDLAIGAPGDSQSSGSKGAVYILLLKKDGSVLFNEKVSADRYESLDRQLRAKEGFGTSLRILDDINGDNVQELAVGSKDGSTTLIVLSKTGHVHAGIKLLKAASMWNERAREPVSLSERFMRMLKKERSSALTATSKAAASDCYFSDTHCQCEVAKAPGAKCLDMARTLGNGQMMCTERACKESYRCSCEGAEYCSHSGVSKTVYKLDETAAPAAASGGEVSCHAEEIQMEKVALIPGAPIPEMGAMEGGAPAARAAGAVWNATHCACTLKNTPGGECMQFESKSGASALCSSRACKTEEMTCDVEGAAMCTHKTVQQPVWLSDGMADKPPLHVCHEESREKEVVECVSGCA